MKKTTKNYFRFFFELLGKRYFINSKEVSKSELFWLGYSYEAILSNKTQVKYVLRLRRDE